MLLLIADVSVGKQKVLAVFMAVLAKAPTGLTIIF
jgi:hypothetical protein